MTVTKRIAECLYVAISTDTGCFKFSNTTSNTHRTAAALIEAGADVYPINKLFFDNKSFSRLRMEAKLTETMEFYADGTACGILRHGGRSGLDLRLRPQH